ncbi:MAG TPA: cupin domain-containing protein, partial [Bradyrhizobium sp.]|nr:cupin domain-containing protein [Bradyrhizobium sp.]
LLRPMHERRSGGPSPVLAYVWSRTEEALRQAAGLDPDPFDDTLLEYQNPMTGGPALPTIGTAIQVVRPGATCRPHRHTGSVVYYVVRGEGTTEIDGQVFEWSKGDFLALPPWAVHAHRNRSKAADAVLFQVNDIPVLKALGLYREQAA